MTAREPYVAAVASREAIDRALASPHLSAGTARVLLAIVRELCSFSRTADTVARSTLAARAGVSDATVWRALKQLTELGVVTWEPGSGRPAAAEGFSVPSRLTILDPVTVASIRDGYRSRKGRVSDQKPSRPGPETVASRRATTGYYTEGSPCATCAGDRLVRDETAPTETYRQCPECVPRAGVA